MCSWVHTGKSPTLQPIRSSRVTSSRFSSSRISSIRISSIRISNSRLSSSRLSRCRMNRISSRPVSTLGWAFYARARMTREDDEDGNLTQLPTSPSLGSRHVSGIGSRRFVAQYVALMALQANACRVAALRPTTKLRVARDQTGWCGSPLADCRQHRPAASHRLRWWPLVARQWCRRRHDAACHNSCLACGTGTQTRTADPAPNAAGAHTRDQWCYRVHAVCVSPHSVDFDSCDTLVRIEESPYASSACCALWCAVLRSARGGEWREPGSASGARHPCAF